MTDEKRKKEEPAISCEICLEEIDHDQSETFEVDDYVHHFCGLDCYSKWQGDRKEKKVEGESTD